MKTLYALALFVGICLLGLFALLVAPPVED